MTPASVKVRVQGKLEAAGEFAAAMHAAMQRSTRAAAVHYEVLVQMEGRARTLSSWVGIVCSA